MQPGQVQLEVQLSASSDVDVSLEMLNPPELTAWTPDTLDNGCITFGSGVYQIGVMSSELLKHTSQDVPPDAADLLQMLYHNVSANEALQRTWLYS